MEINRNGAALFYRKYGSGNKIMLLFHGYGQDHSVFSDCCRALGDDYTCYSFDLFYHGGSSWRAAAPVSIASLAELFNDFLTRESISEFSVIAYSIGSRFVIPLLTHFGQQIRHLILVAPDGIHKNFWFETATRSSLARKIFQVTVKHPQYFKILASMLRGARLLPAKLRWFAERQMNSAEKRQRVFQTWTCFRELKLPLEQWLSQINGHGIRVILLMGKKDPLIQSARLNNFVQGIKLITVKEVDGGHNLLLKILPHELKGLINQSDNQR